MIGRCVGRRCSFHLRADAGQRVTAHGRMYLPFRLGPLFDFREHEHVVVLGLRAERARAAAGVVEDDGRYLGIRRRLGHGQPTHAPQCREAHLLRPLLDLRERSSMVDARAGCGSAPRGTWVARPAREWRTTRR
jgi:hypothetical protein